MIRLPHWFVVSIASLLVLNPALSAGLELYRNGLEPTSTIALALYLLVGLISILYYSELRMPLALALINLVVALSLPTLVNPTLPENALGTSATWYVTGVATLMAITAIRQHKAIAWIGTIALLAQVFTLGGLDSLFISGLGGAVALVAAAHALSVGLENSAKQRELYLETAKATEAATAADSAARQERSKRITTTLQGTLPMLKKIASGQLTDQDRRDAKVLEAELRDEIRGRNLITPRLKSTIQAARLRGVEVVLLDEGGLDTAPAALKEQIIDRLAEELKRVSEGRVAIRARQIGEARVTFVASRSGTAKPDKFLKL